MRDEFGGHVEKKTAAMSANGTDRSPTRSCFFGATGDLAYKKIFPALYGDGPARARSTCR